MNITDCPWLVVSHHANLSRPVAVARVRSRALAERFAAIAQSEWRWNCEVIWDGKMDLLESA